MSAKNYESILGQIEKMTLLELNDFVKAIEEHFGVSAAMSMGSAPAAQSEAAAPKEEKTEFKVTLTAAGDKKIDVIKALRKAVPALGLTEAKNAVENAPTVIAEAAAKDAAAEMKKILEAAGAKVELS